jgi:hypothetical protein
MLLPCHHFDRLDFGKKLDETDVHTASAPVELKSGLLGAIFEVIQDRPGASENSVMRLHSKQGRKDWI